MKMIFDINQNINKKIPQFAALYIKIILLKINCRVPATLI